MLFRWERLFRINRIDLPVIETIVEEKAEEKLESQAKELQQELGAGEVIEQAKEASVGQAGEETVKTEVVNE
jgi:hypothetical protein